MVAGEEQNVIPLVGDFIAAEAASGPVIEDGRVAMTRPATRAAAVAGALLLPGHFESGEWVGDTQMDNRFIQFAILVPVTMYRASSEVCGRF